MKIISKITDFYDFIIGEVGIDEKVVYVRNPEIIDNGIMIKFSNTKDIKSSQIPIVETIAFCGKFVSFAFYENKYHFGEDIDLKKLDAEYVYSKDKYKNTKNYVYNSIFENYTNKEIQYKNLKLKELHGKETSLNIEYNSPVLLIDLLVKFEEKLIVTAKDFSLADFGFTGYMSPQDTYNQIYNFVISTEDTPNTQSNKGKILSHGFDYKKSFRSNNK